MANEFIILQIFFITLGMVVFSLLLNKIMGISPKSSKEFREKTKNLQERMKNAQLTSDTQQFYSLQQESMQLTKEMMKKQILPSCARCIVFWIIFAIIGIFYNPYGALLPFPLLFFGDGWIAVYFLFSFGLTLVIYLTRWGYRKITGKENAPKSDVTEVRNILSRNSAEPQEIFQIDSHEENLGTNGARSDSWKERIKN
jgi:membrane protein insertase Oxa1/YidC/SpoIIIJ